MPGGISSVWFGGHRRPLLAVVRKTALAVLPLLYTAIALVAVANTGLFNSIMVSRLLYGMANQGLLPKPLSHVHRHTQTPHWAVLTLAIAALILIFSGTMTLLASTTSLLLLMVFLIVNASLLRIRFTENNPSKHFSVPTICPVAAILTCVGLMFFVDLSAVWWARAILAIGLGLAVVAQKRHVPIDAPGEMTAHSDREKPV